MGGGGSTLLSFNENKIRLAIIWGGGDAPLLTADESAKKEEYEQVTCRVLNLISLLIVLNFHMNPNSAASHWTIENFWKWQKESVQYPFPQHPKPHS